VSDSPAQRLIAVFHGPVVCRREAGVRAGLTLVGAAADCPAETLILTFLAPAPEDLPGSLSAPSVVELDGQCYRIASPPREWLLWAPAVHVHRNVGATFYRAVPPRPVPPAKRIFWWLVLTLARRRTGQRLLRALRAKPRSPEREAGT
jgi:hypothetical protein